MSSNQFLDYLIKLGAVIGPMAALPQAVAVWSSPSASGVSAASWLLFLCFSCLWLAHALRRKDRVLALSNLIWIVIETIVVLGLMKGGPQ